MKKTLLWAILLMIVTLLFVPSCHRVTGHFIDAEYTVSLEKDGRLYLNTLSDGAFTIDIENKTYRQLSYAEGKELFPESAENDLLSGGTAPRYALFAPEGYEAVIPHLEACELDTDWSVIYACGKVEGERLVGFVQVYEDTVGYFSGGGNYGIEEISHSLLFSYDAESDSFDVTLQLDGAAIVAFLGDTVIYWENRAYYLYDIETKTVTKLVDDKVWSALNGYQCGTTVATNGDYTLIHMYKMDAYRDYDYVYLYDGAADEIYELTVE